MHSRGLTYPLVAGSLIAGVLAAAGFIAIEARSAEPMLPLQLFSVPRFRIAVAFGMVVNLTYYGVLFVLTLFFQRALAFTPLSTGLAFLPLTAGFFVSNVVSGRFVNTFGSRIPMMVGAAIDLIGFILLARVNAQVSYGELILPFLLIPTGMGLAVPAMTGVVLQSVPKSYASTGSAVLNTARQTAGALGVAVFGSLAEGDVEHVAMAVRTASLISGALLVGAIVLAHRMGFSERTTVAHSRPN
jgi:DHA2 family methylenomycin A resistance protein-like MFS transporter